MPAEDFANLSLLDSTSNAQKAYLVDPTVQMSVDEDLDRSPARRSEASEHSGREGGSRESSESIVCADHAVT